MTRSNKQFSIVDVETTGLFPGKHDRIIEIAIIRIRKTGAIIREYSTLVNPNRDVGRTDIHGISAKHLVGAPTFEDVAGDVLECIAGSVFVAHNVNFDRRFVRAEFERIGCALPDFPYLCTMQLAKRVVPSVSSRNLRELCKHFDIGLVQEHSAPDDAFATVRLFLTLLSLMEEEKDSDWADLGIMGNFIDKSRWPSFPCGSKVFTRDDADITVAGSNSYMANLVSRLPSKQDDPAELDEYLALLDRVLEDRRVTQQETEALYSLAMDLGMSKRQVKKANLSYLEDLVTLAMKDGTITVFEEEDLHDVRELLGISESALSKLIRRAEKHILESNFSSEGVGPVCDLTLQGKSICFTGSFSAQMNGAPVQRSYAEKVAVECGMIVKKTVTKSLDILVATDSCSMSGKAKKARAYGTRIITEPVFWQLVKVKVE